MPVTNFEIQWPDGNVRSCFSPSSVIREYFKSGDSYRVEDFVRRSREALLVADERVAQKFGFHCGHAASEIRSIEAEARQFVPSDVVKIMAVD